MKVSISKNKLKIKIKASDVVSMDKTLALIIHEMLVKYLRQLKIEYIPYVRLNNSLSNEHWIEIISCMIQCFDLLSQEDCYHDERESKIIKKGLELFSTHYQKLYI